MSVELRREGFLQDVSALFVRRLQFKLNVKISLKTVHLAFLERKKRITCIECHGDIFQNKIGRIECERSLWFQTSNHKTSLHEEVKSVLLTSFRHERSRCVDIKRGGEPLTRPSTIPVDATSPLFVVPPSIVRLCFANDPCLDSEPSTLIVWCFDYSFNSFSNNNSQPRPQKKKVGQLGDL